MHNGLVSLVFVQLWNVFSSTDSNSTTTNSKLQNLSNQWNSVSKDFQEAEIKKPRGQDGGVFYYV